MNNRDMNIDNRDPKDEIDWFSSKVGCINLSVVLDESKIYGVDTNYNTNKGQKGFVRVNENELNNEMLSFAVSKEVKKAFKEYCKKKKVSQSIVLRELLKALLIRDLLKNMLSDNEQI
jgi:hypothetical protein